MHSSSAYPAAPPQARLPGVCAVQNTIRSAGETVQAEEVEAVLSQHPFITAAAVVGLRHPRWGEQARPSPCDDGQLCVPLGPDLLGFTQWSWF